MSKYAKFGSDDYLKLKAIGVKPSRVEAPTIKTMATKKVVVPKESSSSTRSVKTVKEVEEEVEVIEKIVKKPKKIIEKIVYVSDDEPEVIEKIVKKSKKLSPVPTRSTKKQPEPEPEPEPVKTEREPHINPNTGKRSRRVLGGTEQAQAWNQQMLAIRRAKKEAALRALEED